MTFSFNSEFLQLLNKNIPEEKVDNEINQLAARFNIPFRELADLYVNCLWSEIDGTNIENLIKDFKQEFLPNEVY